MNPGIRNGLIIASTLVVAMFLASEIADGSYGLSALVAAVTAVAVIVRFTGFSADAIFLGFILVGYLVGSRGFAQLMPSPNLPLLPAEAALLLAGFWCAIQCAFERRLPFRNDALNWMILAWLVVGSARLVFDVPRFGFLALRDFAVVYYASFFFIAQHLGRHPRVSRYLIGCLLVGVLAMGPMFGLFQLFERFFMTQLVIAGVPLIYYKGDLLATHLAAGSLLVFHWAQGRARYWAWPASTLMFAFVLSFDSRASLVGGMFALGLLLLAGRWRFPAIQGTVAVLGMVGVLMLSLLFNNLWAGNKLSGMSNRLQSIVDVTSNRRYETDSSSFKGDNNRFRFVWWKNVVLETWETNPLFGLGFGADLARGFVQEYYPEGSDEFSARSPHNVFLGVFGRMGVAGLAVWLGFCAILLRQTWRGLRRSENPVVWSLWCGAWVILVSATFGVVLEGPMGAVIFWTLLGLASALTYEEKETAVPDAETALPQPKPTELVAG